MSLLVGERPQGSYADDALVMGRPWLAPLPLPETPPGEDPGAANSHFAEARVVCVTWGDPHPTHRPRTLRSGFALPCLPTPFSEHRRR